jgi:hypothetical protein
LTPLHIPISYSFSANWYFKQSGGKISYTKAVLLDDPVQKSTNDIAAARLRHAFLPEMFKAPGETTRPSVNLGIGLATIPHLLYGAPAMYFPYQEPWTDTLVKPGENPLDIVKALDENLIEALYSPSPAKKTPCCSSTLQRK